MKQITWSDINIYQFKKFEKAKDIVEQVESIYNIDANNLLISEFEEYVKSLELLKQPPKPKPPTVKLSGYNLTINPSKMCVAQYIDYNNCPKDDFLALLSIIVTPKGSKYGDYDMEQHKERIAKLFSVQDVVDLNYFFQLTSVKSMNYFLTYFTKLLRLRMWWKIQRKNLKNKLKRLKVRITSCFSS